jgi:hypothetical protein
MTTSMLLILLWQIKFSTKLLVLSEKEKAIFEDKSMVTYKQADLASEAHIAKVLRERKVTTLT